MLLRPAFAATFLALSATTGAAQDAAVPVGAQFVFQGKHVSIDRDTTQVSPLVGRFAQASAECGEACLGPVQLADGVEILGEREVLAFLQDHVANNTGLMVDARMPLDRAVGFVPGSVSLPHATLAPENGYRNDILVALGAQPEADGLSFADVRQLLIYDNGPAADDAGILVRHLLAAGYPAGQISYYRGGMLTWAALGLSIEAGSGS